MPLCDSGEHKASRTPDAPEHQLLLQTQLSCTSQRRSTPPFPSAQTLQRKLTRKTRRGALRNPAMTSAGELAGREPAPAPQPPQLPARLVSRPGVWTPKEGSGMSHTPLLPTGPRPAGASETERAGKRGPLPRRGLPAEGGPVLATCPAGTQGGWGPGGRPRWRRGSCGGARPRSGAGAARSRPLPGGGGEESARRYLVGSRQLRAKRREKGKPGPSAFPAEGGGVPAALARLPRGSRESGAAGGFPPTRPWGSRRGAGRPALGSHGHRRFGHPPRPAGVVPALSSSSACGWPGVWVFHRAARTKPRG